MLTLEREDRKNHTFRTHVDRFFFLIEWKTSLVSNGLWIEKIENVKWGSFLPLCLLYSIIFFSTSYFSSAILVIPLIIFVLSGVEGHCCQEILIYVYFDLP